MLARWLDSSTLALASFIVVLYLETSKSLQTLFRLWSTVMVLIAGIYLWGRESTYLIAVITQARLPVQFKNFFHAGQDLIWHHRIKHSFAIDQLCKSTCTDNHGAISIEDF